MAELGKLGEIIAHKRVEVAARLAGADFAAAQPTTPQPAGGDGRPGARFIFEFKRRSPSEGMLTRQPRARRGRARLHRRRRRDERADRQPLFGGSLADLAAARAAFDGPILAKDFIVDPRQVAEARIAGADAVLAILAVLDDGEARAVIDGGARGWHGRAGRGA